MLYFTLIVLHVTVSIATLLTASRMLYAWHNLYLATIPYYSLLLLVNVHHVHNFYILYLAAPFFNNLNIVLLGIVMYNNNYAMLIQLELCTGINHLVTRYNWLINTIGEGYYALKLEFLPMSMHYLMLCLTWSPFHGLTISHVCYTTY